MSHPRLSKPMSTDNSDNDTFYEAPSDLLRQLRVGDGCGISSGSRSPVATTPQRTFRPTRSVIGTRDARRRVTRQPEVHSLRRRHNEGETRSPPVDARRKSLPLSLPNQKRQHMENDLFLELADDDGNKRRSLPPSSLPHRPPPTSARSLARVPHIGLSSRHTPHLSDDRSRRQSVHSRRSHPSSRTHGSREGSAAGSLGPKRSPAESASAGSHADTVWDELSELKSRIRLLESGERPPTATTTPSTVVTSPLREREGVHPLLHAALAKAKPLLQPTLYRSLEATASDALHLAATGFSDRQTRRKADSMCRNLTDLVLALCDGKHESVLSRADSFRCSEPYSPRRAETSYSPAMRADISSLRSSESSRPMSRLEARRSSILGHLEPELSRTPNRYLYAGDPIDPPPRPASRYAYSGSSPGLRETLAARRANSAAYDHVQNAAAGDWESSRWRRARNRASSVISGAVKVE
ncbi:hypothetical protein K470DRAFT_257545 [Piedraia hortae CBS 480.64]|uniref:Uncharacterized protein n=1 Tax=Piedraia hortae CBS 480.64 TaxID=1314780 RepID=A0A6A7C237_9PEZI|nr:hypothetical protein K470DRAFT_257545 [Piedraia hortae CBS 480.64]